MATEELLTKEVRINNLDDMMDTNASIMEEIANDGKMTAVEKMRGFSMGVRNQALLSRDQQARINMLAKLGMKANGQTKSLGFMPNAE